MSYRVLYDWTGAAIPRMCGDTDPGSFSVWAEKADGYAEGSEYSSDENTTVSTGASAFGFGVDTAYTTGDGWSTSEAYGWSQQVGFSAGLTDFYDDPDDPGDDHSCYKVIPYVYQARAQTLSGFSYPYLELDYYVPCIGCGLPQVELEIGSGMLPR
jgi:hypothetical protein